jgi:hypothetical protein
MLQGSWYTHDHTHDGHDNREYDLRVQLACFYVKLWYSLRTVHML